MQINMLFYFNLSLPSFFENFHITILIITYLTYLQVFRSEKITSLNYFYITWDFIMHAPSSTTTENCIVSHVKHASSVIHNMDAK
jgi:hypothetical protein